MNEPLQSPAAEPEGAPADTPVGRTGESDPDFMTSLARGLAVIQAFSPQRRMLTISQISQRTGIPRAAVRRCLHTLGKLGFVSAEEGRNFSLRPRILALGHAYLASAPLANAAQPVLRHISNTLNESSSVAILDGDEILYIARAFTSRIMTIDLHVGSRLPAYCTSMGRVLLCHMPSSELDAYLGRAKLIQHTPRTIFSRDGIREALESVRRNGYAVNDQELEIGLRSIAVPIAAPDGRVVAALNVGVQAARVSVPEMESRFLPVLRDGARELGLLLA
jgi:IclR family pca regulon transcriptional regulator